MSKKIRTEKIYQVLVRPDEVSETVESGRVLNSIREYDRAGNLILEVSYHPDGSISDKNEHEYDVHGKIIRSTTYDGGNEPLETTKINRDKNGHPIKEEIIYMDGSVDTVDYTYEDGLLLNKVRKTDDGDIEQREVFSYNEGNLILYEKYDDDDQIIYQVKNSYNNDIIVKSEIFSSEDDEPFTQVMEYDKEGRRKSELRYDKKKRLVEKNIYETDSHGRVIKVTEENPSRKNTTEFSYDEKGRLLYQKESDINGDRVSEVNREYDDEGMLKGARIGYLDRMTGIMQENRLAYEYEFHE
jgi:hypothetical protein